MRTCVFVLMTALLGGVFALPSPAADEPTKKELRFSEQSQAHSGSRSTTTGTTTTTSGPTTSRIKTAAYS